MTTKPENETLVNFMEFLSFGEIAELYNVSEKTIEDWYISMLKDFEIDYFRILKQKVKTIESDYQNILTNIKISLVQDLNICPIPVYLLDQENKVLKYIILSKIYCFDKNAIDYVNSILNLSTGYILLTELKQYKTLRLSLVNRDDIIFTDFSIGSFVTDEISENSK
jgi:hypothetical protein